jgi:hypothetical protein
VDPIAATESALLEIAALSGAVVDTELAQTFLQPSGEWTEEIRLWGAPGIASARLVERWGAPGHQGHAIKEARKDDFRHFRFKTLRPHLRWIFRESLYSGGLIGPATVRLLVGHPRILRQCPRSLRNYALTRNCALLLAGRDWQALASFVDWTMSYRGVCGDPPSGSDQYYRSQANRYSLLPARAFADATGAVQQLERAGDLERLAGALYEAGSAAVYLADFPTALRFAFDLQYRRGMFAIPRWRAWGAWLEVITRCHMNEFESASEILEDGLQRFIDEGRPDQLYDLRTAQLLCARVRLANVGDAGGLVLEDASDAARTGRYRDDLDLLMADFALARGDIGDAEERIRRVLANPSCPVAQLWAELGWAEVLRTSGRRAEAGDSFASLSEHAHHRGATWLETQSSIGLLLSDDERFAPSWARVRESLSRVATLTSNPSLLGQQSLISRAVAEDAPRRLIVGEPRVLWMLTV